MAGKPQLRFTKCKLCLANMMLSVTKPLGQWMKEELRMLCTLALTRHLTCSPQYSCRQVGKIQFGHTDCEKCLISKDQRTMWCLAQSQTVSGPSNGVPWKLVLGPVVLFNIFVNILMIGLNPPWVCRWLQSGKRGRCLGRRSHHSFRETLRDWKIGPTRIAWVLTKINRNCIWNGINLSDRTSWEHSGCSSVAKHLWVLGDSKLNMG